MQEAIIQWCPPLTQPPNRSHSAGGDGVCGVCGVWGGGWGCNGWIVWQWNFGPEVQIQDRVVFWQFEGICIWKWKFGPGVQIQHQMVVWQFERICIKYDRILLFPVLIWTSLVYQGIWW